MRYCEILEEMIMGSKMSLRELSDKCRGLGVEISPAYISLLKKGKVPPPTPKVSKTLSAICDRNKYFDLIYLSYLEKAPKEVVKYIGLLEKTNDNLMDFLLSKYNFNEYRSMTQVIEKIDKLKINYAASNEMNEGQLEKFIDYMKDEYVKKSVVENEEFFMHDESMEPTIPKNAKLDVVDYTNQSYNLENKDIILYHHIGTSATRVRRIYHVYDNLLLMPDNKRFKVETIRNINQIEIVGRVNSFKATIR